MKMDRMHHADGVDPAVIQDDIGKGFRPEVDLLKLTVAVFSEIKGMYDVGEDHDEISGIACDGFCADIHIADSGEDPVKFYGCMNMCPKAETSLFPACQCACQNITGQGQG